MGLLAVFAFAFMMFFAAIMICVVQIDGALVAWIIFAVIQFLCIAGQGGLGGATSDPRYYGSNFLEQLQIGSVAIADGVLNPYGPLEGKVYQRLRCCSKKHFESTQEEQTPEA